MQGLVTIFLTLFCAGGGLRVLNQGNYAFFRNLDKKVEEYGSRRVFGGELAEVAEFPNICYLTDSSYKIKCSCSIVAAKWALTAGHCVTSKLKHIKYNTRLGDSSGDSTDVVQGFIHPDFKVIEQDEGRGMDVTALYHDIGLVKVANDMILEIPLEEDPLVMMKKTHQLVGNEMKVMGYGKTGTQRSNSKQLFSVRLRSHQCERSTWIPCVCGLTDPGLRTRGVCQGDSGGPVILDGAQVAVTSMGPVECVTQTDPSPGATSVFTVVKDYVDIINDTILGKFGKLTMQPVAMGSTCTKVNHDVVTLLLMLLCFLQ